VRSDESAPVPDTAAHNCSHRIAEQRGLSSTGTLPDQSTTADRLSRDDLATLVATSQQLSAELGLGELLELILETASRMTDSPDSALILHDAEQDGLYFAAATGSDAEGLLAKFGRQALQRVPLESKAGQVFTSGESLIVGDLTTDSGHFKGTDRQTGHVSQSMICVPLTVAGRRIGVMQLLNKTTGGYGGRDMALVEALASQAAVAIRNATLVDDLLAHMGLGTTVGASPLDLLDEFDQPPRMELLTVLFADMRSFTSLANALSMEQLQDVLNEYLTMLCDEIVRCEGTVNKIMGDGVLALFRDEEHARRAVECAFSMTERFDRLRPRWDERSSESLDFIDIGVGIATGEVMLATLGSRDVRDFTPIGKAVNAANALEMAARNGQRIFSDQPTYNAVRDLVMPVEAPETFELTKPGQGVKVPYKRFELRPLADAAEAPRVFVSYNRDDADEVLRLVELLRARSLEVWIDVEQLVPGRPWQPAVEDVLETIACAAVIVGPRGLGDWQHTEQQVALTQFAKREMPVIPVLIPDAGEEPQLPAFLKEFTWVDLRGGFSEEGIDRLEAGIRGVEPGASAADLD